MLRVVFYICHVPGLKNRDMAQQVCERGGK
jgi:hypothetical protein